jgi:hypothetical protein
VPDEFDFDVAVSFAGEDRNYVTSVVDKLKAQEVSVFYDQDFESDMWGANLADYLHEVVHAVLGELGAARQPAAPRFNGKVPRNTGRAGHPLGRTSRGLGVDLVRRCPPAGTGRSRRQVPGSCARVLTQKRQVHHG